MRRILVLIVCTCAAAGMVFAGQESQEKAKPAAVARWGQEQITTPDGVILKGMAWNNKDASTMVVLLHMLGKSWETWKPLNPSLIEKGYSLFEYDARGHGWSTTTNTGKTISFRTFAAQGKDNDWNKMVSDLRAVVEYLRGKTEAAKKQVVLIGASIGANAALDYAASDKSVAAVVLLSPGLNYHDLETEGAAKQYGARPLLIVASMGDAYAYESSQKLEQVVKSANPAAQVKLLIAPGNAHGTNMLSEEMNKKIIQWLDEHLKKPEAVKGK